MKKIIFIFLLMGPFGWGQFFESDSNSSEQEEVFNQVGNYPSDNNEPDQGVDMGGGNPAGPIPINQYLLYLSLVGVVFGVALLRKKNCLIGKS